MPGKFSIRRKANLDLEEIADYILKDNPGRAVSFVIELSEHFQRIADFPLAYPARDEIRTGLRSAVHGSYQIFYMEAGDGIDIIRIVHGARELHGMF